MRAGPRFRTVALTGGRNVARGWPPGARACGPNWRSPRTPTTAADAARRAGRHGGAGGRRARRRWPRPPTAPPTGPCRPSSAPRAGPGPARAGAGPHAGAGQQGKPCHRRAAADGHRRAHGATILPVDSEHSAVFQALTGEDHAAVERIIITASGGPFRDWPLERLAGPRPAEAVAHPNWAMGKRITIDSARCSTRRWN
jgi:1-deoxy-D-xylulose-5-phosphate reductoisomerase